jgi:3-oxoacyl-[acyl-carrier protein] reductase
MIRRRFENKRVVVTGGGRGIGFEVARQFAREGGRVVLFEVDRSLLDGACASLAAEDLVVTGQVVDVADAESVERAVAATGHIDVLINNAGIAMETPFLEISLGEWRRILDVNLTGMFLVAQAVARQMAGRKAGVIVNMGSKNGLSAEAGYGHYNASKGGVVMLSKTMAIELAPFGIRVNCVCPGYIQTPMSQEIDSPAFVKDFVERYVPLHRPGRVEEVAPLFLFLASDEARFISGQDFVVDGGQLAGQKPGPDLLQKLIAAAG